MKILIKASSPRTAPLAIGPSAVRIKARPLRVLDFDCEARPLHWIANDYVSKEITAIAWGFSPDRITCHLLGETELPDILRAFVDAYRQADMVTGHYIRGFDLPLINAMLTEQHMPVLPDKLTQDTKLDAVRRHGLSNSQESWGAMLGLEHDKVKMNQAKWRAANRLTPEGLAEARKRVIGDVQQHMEMRAWMLKLGYLGPPKMWRSGMAQVVENYTP